MRHSLLEPGTARLSSSSLSVQVRAANNSHVLFLIVQFRDCISDLVNAGLEYPAILCK